VFLTIAATVALFAALTALALLVNDAGASATPPCADFGCGGFGARPENVPYELAILALAFATFWGSMWGFEHVVRWGKR